VFDREARLWIVGGISSGEYWHALHRLAARLGIDDAVTFAGSVTQGELGAYFEAADVFVCVSDHEGFCVPLVEAMWWNLPVVAFGSTAIPDTVRDAGVVLQHKQPAVVAAAVHRVVSDEHLRAELIAAGRERVNDFAPEKTATTLLDALSFLR
jgi:glycosyltransferase involved in cell wall biosynthesis